MSSQANLFSDEVLNQGAGQALVHLRETALVCQKCELHKLRTNVVFGTGCAVEPHIAFVGEAPGANEDATGIPFVGKAGQTFDKMLGAMGLTRDQIYICNTLGCRPPENRVPEANELKACFPFLRGQLRVIRPKVIVAMGATAAKVLLKSSRALKEQRGLWYEWEDIPVRVTYHPSGLNRDPSKKPEAWRDLQAVMKRLGLTPSTPL